MNFKERTRKQTAVGRYPGHCTNTGLAIVMNSYFKDHGFPYMVSDVAYDEGSNTLSIDGVMHLKAWGEDSYTQKSTYRASRAEYAENTFYFDKPLSEKEAQFVFPLGLVKSGRAYPTTSFAYSDYSAYDDPSSLALHWVDHIVLNITKDYD